jgi:nucleoside-diphosphate-sugar epimerase
MTRVLVTGGHGFVGSALFERLCLDGWNPLKTVRQTLFPDEFAVGEIDSATDWSNAVLDCRVVIHLAGRAHIVHDTATDQLAAYRTINSEGTLNLARQAAAAGVKRFLFISSIKVNGELTSQGHPFTEGDAPAPQDAYGLSKLEAEQGLQKIALKTGMEFVVIRPPLVYGPGVKANFAALMRVVQKGWPLPLGDVQNRRSLVALDNLIDFIITCIEHPKAANQTFLISDGEDLSTTELVRSLARAAGVPSRLLPVPVWALEWAGRAVGKGDAVQRLCGNLQIDSSKARNLLDWKPKISIQEGLRLAASGPVSS